MTENSDAHLTGVVVALGPCAIDGKLFEFDPDTVPSVLIDPQTRRPPDVGADGRPYLADLAAVARSIKRPVCPAHVRAVNAELRRRGRTPVWADPPDEAG